MCTVIVLAQVVPGLPLVLAANRDELYDRPTDGARWEGDTIVAGVDRVSGGTWMGATRAGLVVAVTNQRTHKMPDPTRRSRGEVVRRALAARDRDAIRAIVAAIDPRDYNGFNLIWGDQRGVEVAYVHDGDAPELVALPAGVTVIANDRIGSREFPRADRAAALANALDLAHPLTGLAGILADHTQPAEAPLPPPGSFITPDTARAVQSICIHTPRYGTRSATVAGVSQAGLAHFLVSSGPPCRSPLVDADRLR